MHRTNIYLEKRQTEKLDLLAAAEGVSRAELIRRLLDRELGSSDEVAAGLAAIDRSFGVLADLEFSERKVDSRARHLDRIWART